MPGPRLITPESFAAAFLLALVPKPEEAVADVFLIKLD